MSAPTPRPVRTLLVANRGEIALRIQRTAHQRGLRTVAVFSDADAGSPHVAAATEAVRLPGTHPRDTYLRADALLDAAVRTGADAVHPGYGFLAEDAAFAAAVEAAGLVWVGPPPAVMDAMARKVEAKAFMAQVGLPTLPSAVVAPGDPLDAAAEAVGLPLLVKASAGGGGKGMRLVEHRADLADAVATAAREAESSFGDGTVFLERYLPAPRHVEVQVLGDRHGTVVHLGDRDCSVQRRHQKVLEEAPAPGLSDALRARMREAAVAAARELGYVGAGTFEFLVDGEDFWFLEVNARLQVEHGVTEAVTGLDLVALQLHVAEGHPLPFGQDEVRFEGHAVEGRLYAEDPATGWLPSTGPLHRFSPTSGPGVRWDVGVATGSTVTPHYDPMLAKAIAVGPTREIAAGRLAAALEGTVVHGVATNAPSLAAIARHPAFLAGPPTTAFLDQHPEVLAPADAAARTARHLVVAVATAVHRAPRRGGAAIAPPRWRNVPWAPARRAFTVGVEVVEVAYRVEGGAVLGAVGDHEVRVELAADDGEHVLVEVDGVRRTYLVERAGPSWHVHGPDGATTALEQPRFTPPGAAAAAGGLVAPVPGTVTRVLVAPGDPVEAGQVVAVLEAMKVEHQIRAPGPGTVDAVLVAPGDSVEAHAPLVRMAER